MIAVGVTTFAVALPVLFIALGGTNFNVPTAVAAIIAGLSALILALIGASATHLWAAQRRQWALASVLAAGLFLYWLLTVARRTLGAISA